MCAGQPMMVYMSKAQCFGQLAKESNFNQTPAAYNSKYDLWLMSWCPCIDSFSDNIIFLFISFALYFHECFHETKMSYKQCAYAQDECEEQ